MATTNHFSTGLVKVGETEIATLTEVDATYDLTYAEAFVTRRSMLESVDPTSPALYLVGTCAINPEIDLSTYFSVRERSRGRYSVYFDTTTIQLGEALTFTAERSCIGGLFIPDSGNANRTEILSRGVAEVE